MLNHEWTRQRDRRILQGSRDARPAEEDATGEDLVDDGYSANDLAALEEAEALAERQVAEALELAEAEAEEVAEAPAEAEVVVPVAEAEPVTETAQEVEVPEALVAPEAESALEPEPELVAEPADRQAVAAGLEVPLSGLRERLQAVLARQTQLPLDIDARRDVTEQVDGSPRETREMLVRRLLDPTLTLEETAVLLGVCPTTVRRYTNRGVLACYRTPGNQRRFHLTDILDFMERQSAPR